MSYLFYGDIGHEPSLEPKEDYVPTVVGHCSLCGEPIYEGDTYYDLFDEMFCDDCISSARRCG